MSAPATDLNLLFAVLALQNDLVGKDALLAAMTVWGLEKHRTLGDILVERGDLLVEDRQLIDGLIERQLRRHTSVEKSLAALSVSPPLRQELQSLCPPEMERRLAHLSTAVDGHATVGYAPTGSADGGLRYRILRPHARGGLGEVFVAEDTELHREVALKEMQTRHAGHEASRGRFVLEAEITGGLEHPGIVPVYGLGSYADGRPFYAMRFIKGDNLREAIARFHRPTSRPDYHSLAFRQLLGRFIDVCNAVAYAHSRGVLHRDLKPGNIMLGRFGETLVVDWGLAKVVGRGEPGALATPDEETLMPRSGSGAVETLAGSAIGTPAYMSPEQAAGRIADLGPATDVYSLGATFYTLLTNQSPVDGTDTADLLRKVERGEVGFVQPALPTSTEAIPAPLVAVCNKAMRQGPRDRYASPLALAEDLEHWLADEPVRAYPEPWTVRAGRWVRRHRTAVTGAVAAVAVATVCLAVATVLLSAARASERQAKVLAEENEQKAQEQRDKARARFALARDAVDRYHTQISESPELKAVGLEKLRTTLLETAAAFYEKFVREDEADASVEAERGRAYWRLGKIYEDTGRHLDAEKAFLQGVAIWQRLTTDHPDASAYQVGLAQGHHQLGWLRQQISRHDEAEQDHLRALAILEALVAQHPRELAFQGHQAAVLNDLGILYNETSRPTLAKDAYDKSLAVCSRLVGAEPDNDEYQLGLERSHNQLANYYFYRGDLTQAEKSHQQALDVAQHLARKHPGAPQYLAELASAHYNLGFGYQRSDQRAKSERAYQDALQLYEKLAGEHPTVVEYQSHQAEVLNMLGDLYRRMDRRADAAVAYQKAVATHEKLFRAYPLVTDFAVKLGGVYCNRGNLFIEQNDYPAATDSLLNARQTLQAVLNKDRRNITAHRYLLNAHAGLAYVYSRRGLKNEAEDAGREVVATREKLAHDLPDSAEEVLMLGGALCNYGHRLFENDKPQPAVDAYTRALDTLDGLRKKDPKNRLARQFLVNTLWGRARALSKSLDRHAEACADLDRAVALSRDADRDSYRGARALILARGGDYRKAVEEALAISGKETANTGVLMDAASAHAVAAGAALKDAKLTAAERDRLAEQYAAAAVALLARAAAKGYFSSAAARADLHSDRDLAPLRMRDDFKKLLTDLENTK
jgi:serine/threonine-protein kinase